MVGGCDGKVRIWQGLRGMLNADERAEVFVPDTCLDGVECGGVCPVQGIHSFGNGEDALALVCVGWDRTVKVLIPSGIEEVGGPGENRGDLEGTGGEEEQDLVELYARMEDGGEWVAEEEGEGGLEER